MQIPKEKIAKQKELYNKGDWKGVADLGKVIERHDTSWNSAVSRLIENECNKKNYIEAFRLADKYQDPWGWNPEIVAITLKRDYGLDGKAEELYKQYMAEKSMQ